MKQLLCMLIISLGFFSLKMENPVDLKLDWTFLQTTTDIDAAFASESPVLFFKHSHKCGLSTLILDDFEKDWDVNTKVCKIVMINVWHQRDLSNYISDALGITHHSPQVIIVQNNKVLYEKTHGKIKVSGIKRVL
jgi:bacillithiol system protein YtxJ